MIRRFAVVAAFAVAGIAQAGGPPVLAQEADAACASALWLAPLATPTTDDAGPAEIAEPAPAWMKTALTDACSGDTFALTDFAGKTLYIEPMATWCTNCRQQLTRATEAFAQLPEATRADIVLVALSSETALPREDLAAYAADTGFPFVFAVMPAEMLQTMAEDLGQEIAVPPATPHLIVAADGTVGALRIGGAAVDDLLALFVAAGDAAAS